MGGCFGTLIHVVVYMRNSKGPLSSGDCKFFRSFQYSIADDITTEQVAELQRSKWRNFIEEGAKMSLYVAPNAPAQQMPRTFTGAEGYTPLVPGPANACETIVKAGRMVIVVVDRG
jgi:hypothetical protein